MKNGEDLTPETVPRLYDGMGGTLRDFVQAYNLAPEQVSLRHSPKIRTKYTGEAVMAGAFQLLPKPTRQEDLAALVKSLYDQGLDVLEVPILGYADLTLNMDAVKTLGETKYMNVWMNNPDSDTIEGKPNSSFNHVIRTRGAYLREFVNGFAQCTRDLAHLSTHGGNVDALVLSLANSARTVPATLTDIGGMFEMEHYAQLVLDQKGKSGSYKASLQRNGSTYPVDFKRFLNA